MFGIDMNFDFAYSNAMQLILLICSLVGNLCWGYIMTNIILLLFNEQASMKQKLLFSFMTGVVLNTGIIYIAYALNGFQALPPFILLVIATPSPLNSLLTYYCRIKILKLSKYRAVQWTVMFYLYALITKAITRAIGLIFFPQHGEAYNFLLDATAIFAGAIFMIICYWVVTTLIKHEGLGIQVTERVFVTSPSKILGYGFITNCAAYCLIIVQYFIFDNEVIACLYSTIILALSLWIEYYWILSQANKLKLHNKNEHIKTLITSIDEFRGIKHDFYDILQTYSGYIQLGDLPKLRKYHEAFLNTTVNVGDQLELNKRIEENPALIGLLLKKQKQAHEQNIHTRFTLTCEISNLYIENISLCRSLSSLLDNAIEEASESEERMLTFSLGQKSNGNILITLINSTLVDRDINAIMFLEEPTNMGLRLVHAKKVLSKFGNCIFQYESYSKRFTVYIEICA